MQSSSNVVGKLRLPHPYLTLYTLQEDARGQSIGGQRSLTLVKAEAEATALPEELHRKDAVFTLPVSGGSGSEIPLSVNTAWARARRAPHASIQWRHSACPSTGQMWLIIYAIFIQKPTVEAFRLSLDGPEGSKCSAALVESHLAHQHPRPPHPGGSDISSPSEILISRSAFWQGAGSPFGSYPPWAPASGSAHRIFPKDYVLTTRFPDAPVHSKHPRRSAKPPRGAVVYSRYIASLDRMFSMVHVDWRDDEHVALFNRWQNDPRVAAAWNETGTLEQHRAYLRRQDGDPHTMSVFGRFDGDCFAYYEIFWAKEDTTGAHYDAGDFDRGRHLLVGDARFRGPKYSRAWWPCTIHYCFLDDARTERVMGEPNASNTTVLKHDYAFGLNAENFIDFPHKRSVLVKVTRERFFQSCPLFEQGSSVMGTGLPLPNKL